MTRPLTMPQPIIVATVWSRLDRCAQGNVAILAEFSDGSFADVVLFYSDEHDWTLLEFLGLTAQEASDRIHAAYVRYFQSA